MSTLKRSQAWDVDLQARPDLVQAFQQAAAASGTANRGSLGRTAADGMTRSRGTDERAVKAANEVRKKAAARGVNVRPQPGVPAQSIPPLGDLLSLINSGVAGKAPVASTSPGSSSVRAAGKAAQTSRAESTGKKASASTSGVRPVPVAHVANGPAERAAPGLSGPSPLGLGDGLGGLAAKKKKVRSKNPA